MGVGGGERGRGRERDCHIVCQCAGGETVPPASVIPTSQVGEQKVIEGLARPPPRHLPSAPTHRPLPLAHLFGFRWKNEIRRQAQM